MGTMLHVQATRTASRLRKLLRRKEITRSDLAIADTLLWSCRRPGTPDARVALGKLASLTSASRNTVIKALRRLCELGVIRVRKTRIRVAWGDSVASRQGVNIYSFIARTCVPDTEFSDCAVSIKQAFKQEKILPSLLDDALARLGEAVRRKADENHCRDVAEGGRG
jgi:Fe2+ or Zn2+ uptake regulation protein